MLPERLEWLTTGQIEMLALPGLPGTRRGIDAMALAEGWADPAKEGTQWRPRKGRGAGIEYRWVVLPEPARLKLALDYGKIEPLHNPAETKRREAWAWFARLSGRKQEEAKVRSGALNAWELLMRGGMARTLAAQVIVRQHKVGLTSLYRWREMVDGIDTADWLPALAPRHIGRADRADMPEEAWQVFLADYLRPEQPNLTDCYRRIEKLAPTHDWGQLPSERTFQRRIKALPPDVVILGRDGREALDRLYPAQKRDKTCLHALEAVNLDGHKWDVAVQWQDGQVGRPQMLTVQDIYSGAVLAWRVDRTLHKGLVRLAIGDVVEQWGIPEHCTMDNGRENAAKWISGGVPNRYRFKVRDEDVLGLLPQLGIEVHWAQPYRGQSKPIERAFRDFAGGIAKHPAFAGAYMGNKPDAKPENYGSAAVPIERFLKVMGEEIAEHNLRPGRDSDVCAGKLSFAQVLDASLKLGSVRRASPEQRLLWLLAADAVRASRQDGSLDLAGNRFWHEKLLPFRGERLVVRYDPDALHADAHVFSPAGDYLVAAPCVEPVGFYDAAAARKHAATKRAFMRATREALDAERRLTISEVAARLAQLEAPDAPERPDTPIIRPVFGNTALKLAIDDEEEPEGERLLLQFARRFRTELRAVDDDS